MFKRFFENIINKNYSFCDYEYEKYDCELAELSRKMKNADVRGLMDFWEQKAQHKIFQTAHPIYNHIMLKATKSFKVFNVFNIIFLCDETMKYPLILLQFSDCFNSCFYEDENGECRALMLDGWRLDYRHHFHCLAQELKIRKDEDFSYKDVEFGFTLSNCRPYHYFYFALFYFENLKLGLKKVFKDKLFFFTDKIKTHFAKEDENLVYFQPYVRENAILTLTQYSQPLEQAFSQRIFKESLVSKEFLASDGGGDYYMYDLHLWLGIPGERRKWLQSNDGIALILKNLTPYFSSIKVFVDGMTAYDGERIEIENNLESFEQISYEVCQALEGELKAEDKRTFIINSEKTNIKLKSLSGYDYRSKICYCHLCDIVISETSTTALVPFHFCRKPGVIFYPLPNHKHYAENFAKEIPNLYALEEEYFFKDGCVADYNICPEHLYNLTAQSLEGLAKEGKLHAFKNKELKMHRLKVPKVKLYAKKTELEEKYNINISLETASLNLEFEEKLNSFLQAQNAAKIIATGAVLRVRNHLAYKLGQSMIKNSKSILGSILMPYILIGIAISHKRRKNKVKLPPLQNYGDYQQALKEKESFTYKLGLAFIKANKTLLIGGYFKFFFKELPKLRAELEKKKARILKV